ncbi:MAG: hypothetical protein FWG96_01680 [Methanomassiliicoccaceae archaeon]|nr:hypothetical protein [Methanomassiliicoccaceae archaeon]
MSGQKNKGGLSISFVAKQKTGRKAVFHIGFIPLIENIRAKIPKPNDNTTMRMGNKILVDSVFASMGLDVFLDSLKHDQGDSVSKEAVALVANSMEI